MRTFVWVGGGGSRGTQQLTNPWQPRVRRSATEYKYSITNSREYYSCIVVGVNLVIYLFRSHFALPGAISYNTILLLQILLYLGVHVYDTVLLYCCSTSKIKGCCSLRVSDLLIGRKVRAAATCPHLRCTLYPWRQPCSTFARYLRLCGGSDITWLVNGLIWMCKADRLNLTRKLSILQSTVLYCLLMSDLLCLIDFHPCNGPAFHLLNSKIGYWCRSWSQQSTARHKRKWSTAHLHRTKLMSRHDKHTPRMPPGAPDLPLYSRTTDNSVLWYKHELQDPCLSCCLSSIYHISCNR